ncbi:MAG: hypothetical protein FWF53_04475 [Candidatus Azobacteroides sp.]|nr:hypothetical protein [Candidatus Azobacteroides sp.]
MEILGTIGGICDDTDQPHTKQSGCSSFEGITDGFYFTNPGALFDTDEEAFNEEIKNAVYESGIKRVIPVFGLTAVTVNGGDIRTNQEGWGPEMPTGTNAVREDYIIPLGGECLYKQVAKMNKRSMRVFRVDQAMKSFGTAIRQSDEIKQRGFLLNSVYVTLRKETEGQIGAIILSLFYSVNYENELINKHSVQLGEKAEGLSGIYLEKGSASGKAKVRITCSGDDVTSVYGSDLADRTLYLSESGTNPSSVEYNSSGELTITPAGKYRIADAATLKNAGIEGGYEGENIFGDIA